MLVFFRYTLVEQGVTSMMPSATVILGPIIILRRFFIKISALKDPSGVEGVEHYS